MMKILLDDYASTRLSVLFFLILRANLPEYRRLTFNDRLLMIALSPLEY